MAIDPGSAPWHTHVINLRRLSVFRGLLDLEPLKDLLRSADAAAGDLAPSPSSPRAPGAREAETKASLLYRLSLDDALWSSPEFQAAKDPWEAWLIRAVISNDNAWSRLAECGEKAGSFMLDLVRSDLSYLQQAGQAVSRLLIGEGTESRKAWRQGAPPPAPPCRDERARIAALLSSGRAWPETVSDLASYFGRAGAGWLNGFSAFRWTGRGDRPLEPVRFVDPIRLDDLVGYERPRGQVIANTERLIGGLPSQNLLLYGDRGTGKSATVKALVHRYADQGLRLVEVPRERLTEIDRVAAELGRRGLRFILFVDDLSFESAETEYKALKAALEGSLEPPKGHVRVYATSNRRHLVSESFADRTASAVGPAADEVRRQDTLQEKLSLADRFGITVIFASPAQSEYLEIVRELAKKRGISISADVLDREALRWADWHNGLSPRSAKQFVESLVER